MQKVSVARFGMKLELPFCKKYFIANFTSNLLDLSTTKLVDTLQIFTAQSVLDFGHCIYGNSRNGYRFLQFKFDNMSI